MEVRELDRPIALSKDLGLTLQRRYLGATIVGEKYQIANLSTHDLPLVEHNLFKPGVMAVSLEADLLHAGATTNAFIIRERRGDD
jgi:conjugal transfer pilus assembly protein TraK